MLNKSTLKQKLSVAQFIGRAQQRAIIHCNNQSHSQPRVVAALQEIQSLVDNAIMEIELTELEYSVDKQLDQVTESIHSIIINM